jgi:hypothetical protein
MNAPDLVRAVKVGEGAGDVRRAMIAAGRVASTASRSNASPVLSGLVRECHNIEGGQAGRDLHLYIDGAASMPSKTTVATR